MSRASLGLYTTEEDLLVLVDAIKDLIARQDEIHQIYEPIGSNGYQHKTFSPHKTAIFDPVFSLQKALISD